MDNRSMPLLKRRKYEYKRCGNISQFYIPNTINGKNVVGADGDVILFRDEQCLV